MSEESLLHAVHTTPRAFLVRVLVERLLEPMGLSDDLFSSRAARELGITCLRSKEDATRYPWPENESPDVTITKAHLRALLPIVDNYIEDAVPDAVINAARQSMETLLMYLKRDH